MDDEADHMERILLSIEPEDLYTYTLARLNNRDPTVIDALKKLLPAMDFHNDSENSEINITDNNVSANEDEYLDLLQKRKHGVLKINNSGSLEAEENSKIKRSSTKSKAERKKSNTLVKKHCIRCHKNFNANSESNCEKRCQLQHPEDMVVRKKHVSFKFFDTWTVDRNRPCFRHLMERISSVLLVVRVFICQMQTIMKKA